MNIPPIAIASRTNGAAPSARSSAAPSRLLDRVTLGGRSDPATATRERWAFGGAAVGALALGAVTAGLGGTPAAVLGVVEGAVVGGVVAGGLLGVALGALGYHAGDNPNSKGLGEFAGFMLGAAVGGLGGIIGGGIAGAHLGGTIGGPLGATAGFILGGAVGLVAANRHLKAQTPTQPAPAPPTK